MDIDVGQTIGGRYELVRLIGRGGMGEVWEAQHRTLGERVVVKLITPGRGGDRIEAPDRAAARFRFEAQIAARLSRKTRHIVSVTDHGDEDGVAYLVMEPLIGETLDALLVREGSVPLERAVDIVTQVARALTHAHADRVWHRDLKPANVFLSKDEDGHLLVKLLDFGIARAARVHAAPRGFTTAKGIIIGTPSYMSPEQALGSSSLDHGCDLWALATVAYRMLAGQIPFPGRDPGEMLECICACVFIPFREHRPDLAALDAFFARAYAKEPSARFQSASELANDFASRAKVAAASVATAAGSAPSTLDAESIPAPPKSLRSGVWTGAILAVALALAGAAFFAFRASATSPHAASSGDRAAPSALPTTSAPSSPPSATIATSAQPGDAGPTANGVSVAPIRPTPQSTKTTAPSTSARPSSAPTVAPPRPPDKSEVL